MEIVNRTRERNFLEMQDRAFGVTQCDWIFYQKDLLTKQAIH